jgi:hypothetical protein
MCGQLGHDDTAAIDADQSDRYVPAQRLADLHHESNDLISRSYTTR